MSADARAALRNLSDAELQAEVERRGLPDFEDRASALRHLRERGYSDQGIADLSGRDVAEIEELTYQIEEEGLS